MENSNEIKFEVTDNFVIKRIPAPQLGKDVYMQDIVMDKETFIKCYEKWILNKKEEKEKR